MSLIIDGKNVSEEFELVTTERQGTLDNKLPDQPSDDVETASDSIQQQPDQIHETVVITPDVDEPLIGFGPDREEKQSSLEEQLQFFFDLRDSRDAFSVETPEREIENAQLLSVVYTRTASLSYRVQLTFREMQIEVDEDERGEGAEGGEKNEGQKADEAADTEDPIILPGLDGGLF